LQVLKSDTPLGGLLALAFSPDGRTLLTGNNDQQTLQRWELATGKRRLPFRFPPSAQPPRNRQSDGLVCFIGGPGGGTMPSSSTEPLKGPVLSPDGRLMATLLGERLVICELKAQRLVASLVGSDRPLETVAFSPDSRLVAAGGQDGWVYVWDV